MAVSLTSAELGAALRLSDSPEEQAEATRLLAYVTEAVTQYAPDAPDAVHNESAIRLAGYLYDMPFAGRGESYANALRNSGAARMLLPYRIHSVGTTRDAIAAAQQAVGSLGNPVTNVQVVGGDLVVTFADGTSNTDALPAGGGGGVSSGIDQTARDSADGAQLAAEGAQSTADGAQTAADGAQSTAEGAQATAAAKIDADAVTALITEHTGQHNAHHTPPHISGGGGIVPVLNGRLPSPPVAMRFGWNQSQTHSRAPFVRAGQHPIDGSNVGMSDGLALPPFPPALNSDPTLYLHLWLAGTPDVAAIRRNASTDPMDVTDMFPDRLAGALSVEGVEGTAYVSNVRLASMEGIVYDALIAGATLATIDDLEAHTADAEAHHVAALAAAAAATPPVSLASPSLNVSRSAFSLTTAQATAVIGAWTTYSNLVLAFRNAATGGTTHHRLVTIPTIGALSGVNQDVIHFDYGTHADTNDHDGRMLILESSNVVTVQLSSSQTFAVGETLTIYGVS